MVGKAHLAPPPAWDKLGDVWERRMPEPALPPEGPGLSEPRNCVGSITTSCSAKGVQQGKEGVNLRIVRMAPLTPEAPNGTCQGLDPGPLKEPGRAVVIIQLIVRGIPAGIDPAVRWLVAHVFILRGRSHVSRLSAAAPASVFMEEPLGGQQHSQRVSSHPSDSSSGDTYSEHPREIRPCGSSARCPLPGHAP